MSESDDEVPIKSNRLQRRDTPHHLKNKRINSDDEVKVAEILAQVCNK